RRRDRDAPRQRGAVAQLVGGLRRLTDRSGARVAAAARRRPRVARAYDRDDAVGRGAAARDRAARDRDRQRLSLGRSQGSRFLGAGRGGVVPDDRRGDYGAVVLVDRGVLAGAGKVRRGEAAAKSTGGVSPLQKQ